MLRNQHFLSLNGQSPELKFLAKIYFLSMLYLFMHHHIWYVYKFFITKLAEYMTIIIFKGVHPIHIYLLLYSHILCKLEILEKNPNLHDYFHGTLHVHSPCADLVLNLKRLYNHNHCKLVQIQFQLVFVLFASGFHISLFPKLQLLLANP